MSLQYPSYSLIRISQEQFLHHFCWGLEHIFFHRIKDKHFSISLISSRPYCNLRRSLHLQSTPKGCHLGQSLWRCDHWARTIYLIQGVLYLWQRSNNGQSQLFQCELQHQKVCNHSNPKGTLRDPFIFPIHYLHLSPPSFLHTFHVLLIPLKWKAPYWIPLGTHSNHWP